MALPKLPTLQEVFDSPEILLKYPIPVILEFRDRLLQLDQEISGSSSVPPSPVEMAILNPRFRYMDARHAHYIGERVADAVESSGHIILTVPPQHLKSTTCSVWTPFWYLAKYPDRHVFLISSEAGFARRWGVKVRNLISLYGKDYGLALDPKQTAGDNWQLLSGGSMTTNGAGGVISGHTVDLLIVDDAIKNDEEARSQTVRDQMWEWWDQTVAQRILPETTVIVIGTRYHEDDLTGRLLLHSQSGDGVHFDEITLRAKSESDDPLGRPLGEGLWLARFPQSYYDTKESAVSAYAWSSIYQQRPSPPGGNMVDPEWWSFYRPSELPASFDQEIQTWDLSLDAEKRSDSYHAGLLMSRRGASIYIRDAFHEHCQAPRVIDTIRTWNAIFPTARYKLVERAIAGPFLIQTLHHEITGLVPWPPKGRRKGSKEACLNACVPDIRSGNVYLPLLSDGTRPRWVQDFIEELRQFPRAPHDDYVDSFSQGMAFMLPGVRDSIGRDHSEALSVRPQESPESTHTQILHALVKKLGSKKVKAMQQEEKKQNSSVIPFGQISTAPRVNRPTFGFGRRGTKGMW